MTADEMFKELGYEKIEHNYGITGKVISYESDDFSPVDFMFDSEQIKIWDITIGMQELKAINKKVEELRMEIIILIISFIIIHIVSEKIDSIFLDAVQFTIYFIIKIS